MLITASLQDIIKKYVRMDAPSSKGWCAVLCAVCNDHGKKGKRAAFRFEDSITNYTCFNCEHKAYHNDSKRRSFSREMETVLSSFGIPSTEYNKVLFNSFTHTSKVTDSAQKIQNYVPAPIDMPDHMVSLEDALESGDQWADVAIEYLKWRNVDINYGFYISNHEKWKGRLIIPVYYKNSLIYYQGRAMYDTKIQKYRACQQNRENVMFGMDEIYNTRDTSPLYITEGIFDAIHVNGVAILGKELTKGQIYHLSRSHRQLVYVPDKSGQGYNPALKALSLGWSVACPDIGECKDIDEAVRRFGKMWVYKTLKEKTYSGILGEVSTKVYCKND